MKQFILLALCLTLTGSILAQSSLSGGLLGAGNYTNLNIRGVNTDNIDHKGKLGWAAGLWLNFPLGDAVSLEPQFLYSLHGYQSINRTGLVPAGNISYFSVPLLLKLHVREYLALTLGPQFDFFANIDNHPDGILKEHFASPNLGISAGIELVPHAPLVVFARYVHGLTDLDDRDPGDDAEYYHSNIQVGAKLRLFGSFTPKDTDGDGIADRDDACPLVAGLAIFAGCPDTDNDGITDAEDECPSIAGVLKYRGCPIPDTDGDGVNDEVDKCINVRGVAKYDGCPVPDTDGDGINDEEDKCPTVAGISRYDGCPIPDTDGDGINDEIDKCPSVPGLAEFEGCPNPDRDGDGVPDAIDLCPSIPGPASNDGCPIIESPVFNTRMINFETGKATLTAESKRSLKEGAALINSGDFAKLKIEVQGHTDHVGSNESNHTLSHRRADAVRLELIKNGVSPDRLTATGYGEEKPIADNNTAEGRALNRRVELKPRE